MMETLDLSTQLNERQLEAVLHREGPLLLIAGAGSGKTRVVTFRIIHLISTGIDPSNILAVTFTNKAAKEMQERIATTTQAPVSVSTFHSLGLRILRERSEEAGLQRGFLIYDEEDSLKLLKSVLRRMEIPESKVKAKVVRSCISRMKNGLLSCDEANPPEVIKEKFEEIYVLYQSHLHQSNAVDFDDLLFRVVHLFQNNEQLLAYYQRRWRYLLVDEYQDTNHVQYQMIKLLAGKTQNLFVVGDPDQSIYSWRGAEVENILCFEKDFVGAKVVQLEQNYRSRSRILQASNGLITRNAQRYEKNLWSDRGEGEKVLCVKCFDAFEEAELVAKAIADHHLDRSVPYAQQVIFYRTNFQSRVFEDALMRRHIPYHIVGGISFYQRREIKDILAYLKLALGGCDTISFARTINLPKRGIGEKTLAKWMISAEKEGERLLNHCYRLIQEKGVTAKQKEGLLSYLRGIEAISKAAEEGVGSAVTAAIENTGYLDYLALDPETAQDRRDNLYELCYKAQEWEANTEKVGLEGFLEELTLRGQVDEADFSGEKVSLMTIHNGKGLEFDIAYLVGMEEQLFPHVNCGGDNDAIEEERRLCYVGMTRARERLYLLHAIQRRLWGTTRSMQASRFLSEIPKKYIEQRDFPYSI